MLRGCFVKAHLDDQLIQQRPLALWWHSFGGSRTWRELDSSLSGLLSFAVPEIALQIWIILFLIVRLRRQLLHRSFHVLQAGAVANCSVLQPAIYDNRLCRSWWLLLRDGVHGRCSGSLRLGYGRLCRHRLHSNTKRTRLHGHTRRRACLCRGFRRRWRRWDYDLNWWRGRLPLGQVGGRRRKQSCRSLDESRGNCLLFRPGLCLPCWSFARCLLFRLRQRLCWCFARCLRLGRRLRRLRDVLGSYLLLRVRAIRQAGKSRLREKVREGRGCGRRLRRHLRRGCFLRFGRLLLFLLSLGLLAFVFTSFRSILGLRPCGVFSLRLLLTSCWCWRAVGRAAGNSQLWLLRLWRRRDRRWLGPCWLGWLGDVSLFRRRHPALALWHGVVVDLDLCLA
mmetsp:Transcript_56716/g.132570  ORF Transcript_56716/g.132570 Transcript_56716/m.132570 type:complete len:394 (-) Transcript_56716:896-2077(-)